jgi:hypothetical protein
MGLVTERAGVVGLAAFLAIDVVLVALAMGSTHSAGSAATGAGPVGAAVTTTTTGAPATAATSPGTGSTVRVDVAPVSVGLFALDQKTAVRFTVGSCDKGGSAVEVTQDGGATWTSRPAPFQTVVRLRVRPDRSLFAVGADQGGGCVPSIRHASSLSGSWGSTSRAAGVWFRDPRSAATVGLPVGGTGKPCPGGAVTDLSMIDAGAAALCDSGEVLVSQSGSSWQSAGSVAGGLAVAVDSKSQPYAVVTGIAACRGLAVVRPAAPATVIGCVAMDLSRVTPGSVALSVAADGGWLRVGSTVYRSDATLGTWTAA